VAVKTPAGVFYFTDTIPLAAVTVPCEMAQQDWLSQWKQIQVCLLFLFLGKAWVKHGFAEKTLH
jgi:hypothetical protein